MLTAEVKLLKTMDTSITGGAEYTVMSLYRLFFYFYLFLSQYEQTWELSFIYSADFK